MFLTPTLLKLCSDIRVVIRVGFVAGLCAGVSTSVARSGWELILSEFFMGVAYLAWVGTAGYATQISDVSMKGEVQGLCTALVSLSEATGPPVYGALLSYGEA